MTSGVDQLASILAWWLSHPWQLLGVYCVGVLVDSFIRAAFRRASQ